MKNDLPTCLANDRMLPATGIQIFRIRLNQPYELHWHKIHELTLVISGKGANVVKGTPRAVNRGDLFLLIPADFHEIFPVSGEILDGYNLIFSEDAVNPEVTELLYKHASDYAVCLEEDEIPLYSKEFERISLEIAAPQTGQQTIVRGTLERLLIDLLRKCNYKPVE